ncbi:MAG TPA: helix-turn-helix domain-containing protein [Candidatus Limnocylindria bacterium]|nr:helix-turn-helix domain-containing protein [Candidatus Limnocylindria bacterium]
MFKEILEEIGLSPNEAKIYEGLINIGQASVPEISANIGVHKRNVYDIIPKLLNKGLIYKIAEGGNRYGAVAPNKLSDLIWEKESKLNSILPTLNHKFKKTSAKEEVYIYKGVEGFKNYLRDILEVGEDVYFIGAKGGWFDRKLQPFIKKFLAQAKKQNIKYHHIFDNQIKNSAPDVLKSLGKPYKFLPQKYSTTGAIDIFGDHIVTFSGLRQKEITEDITLVVIINKELANCYRTWFQFMWDNIN